MFVIDKKYKKMIIALILFISFIFPIVLFSLNACVSNDKEDKLVPKFDNGMAQPVFPYTSGATEDYDNENSTIDRFCVWVETSNDTDNDGNLDLVKVFVQVPKSASQGNYKAPCIFEARPYISGITSFNRDKLLEDLVSDINPASWYYYNKYENQYCYEDLTWYDYFLVRGYAVVCCAGLGTLGSDGFESVGSNEELDAFASVIKWLHGETYAYTSKDKNDICFASWSNKNIGMTGRSYAGSIQNGLALRGVEGLKTVVPVAGIASWYEYTNEQGTRFMPFPYNSNLAIFCTSRIFNKSDWSNIKNDTYDYLNNQDKKEDESNGNYSDYWQYLDYTENNNTYKTPVLLIHGLNDNNVTTKHMQMMYNAYKEHNGTIKMLLHQNGHVTPTMPIYNDIGYKIRIGDILYDELLNKWFSHYLFGIDNDIEDMPEVIVQDNVNGEFKTLDTWKPDSFDEYNLSGGTITSKNFIKNYKDRSDTNWHHDTNENVLVNTIEIPMDLQMQGSAELKMNITINELPEDSDNLTVSAYLCDENDEVFNAYILDNSEVLPYTKCESEDPDNIEFSNKYDIVKYNQSPTKSKTVSIGHIDLANPSAKLDSKTAVKEQDDIKVGNSYDYSIYLDSNYYKFVAGHKMKLYLFTYDTNKIKDECIDIPERDNRIINWLQRPFTFTVNKISLCLPKQD